MEDIYYKVGVCVVWSIIAIIASVIMAFIYIIIRSIISRINNNDRIMYYLGRRFPTSLLRSAYQKHWSQKIRLLTLKYRLRNIKDLKRIKL